MSDENWTRQDGRCAYRRRGNAAGGTSAASGAARKPAHTHHAGSAGTASLTAQQRAALYGIARDTWRFYAPDVDPVTHLPLDNLGPGSTRGAYTSAANIGVYLWAVVAGHDLGLIGTAQADQMAGATLREVATLKRYAGFLYQWYDTNNGNVLLNPGQGECAATSGTNDNCSFLSAVDNGWYATGLIEVRQGLPDLRGLALPQRRAVQRSANRHLHGHGSPPDAR